MDPLHLTHLMVICLWGGFVLAEAVVELAARDEASHRQAARLHYWMDLVIELPLLLAVLLTGALLVLRSWPLTMLHWVKIGAGIVAVSVNLWCVAIVLRRHTGRHDFEGVRRLGNRIRVSAAIGLPFGLTAAYFGLTFFRR